MKSFTARKAYLVVMSVLSIFVFASGATAAGPSPVNLRTAGDFVLLRTDRGSTEGTRYKALDGDRTITHIALDESRRYLLTRIEEVMIRNYRFTLYQLKPPAWPLPE